MPSSSSGRIRSDVRAVRVDTRRGAAIVGRCSEETRRRSESTLILNFHEEPSERRNYLACVSAATVLGIVSLTVMRKRLKRRGEMTTDETEERGKKKTMKL